MSFLSSCRSRVVRRALLGTLCMGSLGVAALALLTERGDRSSAVVGAASDFVRLSSATSYDDELLDERGHFDNFKTAYITIASYPHKCVHLHHDPSHGAGVVIKECPGNEDLVTKFLVPVGVVGPVRPVARPDLCLDSPEGSKLQLWSCDDIRKRQSIDRLHFLLRPEEPTWMRYDHYDLPGNQDAGQMSAADLTAVQERVQHQGYAGFAVWHGQAWIKSVQEVSKSDLTFKGESSTVAFYLRRPRGDFTLRPAHDPGLCLGLPHRGPPKDSEGLKLLPCGVAGMYAELEKTRLGLHYATLSEVEEARLRQAFSGQPQKSKQKAPTKAPSPNDLLVSMTLTNLDYNLLMANSELRGLVKSVVKQEMANAAGNGIKPDCVSLAFKEGSVRADGTIHVPGGVPLDVVVARLHTTLPELKDSVAKRVTALPGIAQVTTGYHEVEHEQYDYGKHIREFFARIGAAFEAPMHWVQENFAVLLGATLGIVTAVCCLAACFSQRARFRAMWNSARAGRQTNLEKANSTLSVYKTREPMVNINNPGVWRMGRIVDRGNPDQASYDVTLDSVGDGRPATLALDYSPMTPY